MIERIERKIEKLKNQLKQAGGSSSWGSQRKEFLSQQILLCQSLLVAYKKVELPKKTLDEVKKILDQQCEFESLKKVVLEEIQINSFLTNHSSEKNFPTLLLVGPSGTGKTSFCKILAQALNKPFLSLALGGESKSSILLGTSPEAPRSEEGKIVKFLAETKRNDPVILLDEIDKTFLHESLIHILDPTQNQNIYDRCLDLELDFSKIIFIATANELKKVPISLRSRMTVIELKKYSQEEKKQIARNIIQQWFKNNSFNDNWLEIDDEALETVINKTQEKGVRQLKALLENNIFRYCLLKWAEREAKGETTNKIIITTDLVNQIIPQKLSNVDEDIDQKNHREQPDNLQKELKIFQKLRQLEKKYAEMNNLLSKERQTLQSNDKFNWNSKKNPWLIFSIIILIFSSVLIIISIRNNWQTKAKNKK